MRELLGQFVTFAAISGVSIFFYIGWKEHTDSIKKANERIEQWILDHPEDYK